MRTAMFHAAALILLAGCGADPEQSLVARWNFDEPHGEIAEDASANGNTGSIRNGSRSPGRTGSSLQLDGSGDSIVIVPISNSLRGTADAVTLSAWAYRTAKHNVALIAYDYPTLFFGFHGLQFKFQLALTNGRGGVCYADPEHRAELGRWYHVAATYNGWVARLYVDGSEICSDWTWGAIAMPDVPFTIGAYLDAEGQIIDEMSGLIDDVRIYDQALSASQIRQLASGAL